MSSPDSPLVRVTHARGVTTITLDSPHNRNALSHRLMSELLAALAEADADDRVRAIVLDHTGPVFCSGADLAETAAAAKSGQMPAALLGTVLGAVARSSRPVVAVVRGPARAGGLGLIAAADLAVCAAEATFAFTEVRLGVVPALISATVLPRLAPRAAAELYLTGDVFGGARAAEVGLVTATAPAGELDAIVERWCHSLVRGAPASLAMTKELLRRRPEPELDAELAYLSEVSLRFFGSAEGREGVAAFREKRDAAWVPASDETGAGVAGTP
ncbi:enoyl-CoA hydratase-related protein [Catellatospora bangladeshensis]|uniref:Enoyl-CoA hydratase n=1 Tax=Catellatospora bangladeshensis TaxID=310355 RepID=A0A8J3JIV7_9ACTN|nr:enoyl-CoA hydratase-related protein [Catellatospora bangladeshensis]GIF85536.1 enoyl-CoA hydratase [Catellatospora bangladeshensis]